MEKRHGELKLNENLGFQTTFWTVQRVAWVVGALILAAAAVGLLGRGPLSGAHASTGDGALAVEYLRFARHRGPTDVEVRAVPQAGQETVQIWLGTRYLAEMSLQRVTPEPDTVETRADAVGYEFLLAEPGRPLTVVFSFNPTGIGIVSTDVAVEAGPQLSLTQVLYP